MCRERRLHSLQVTRSEHFQAHHPTPGTALPSPESCVGEGMAIAGAMSINLSRQSAHDACDQGDGAENPSGTQGLCELKPLVLA
jgi:hypothetical protein